jgi:hypothetical protein
MAQTTAQDAYDVTAGLNLLSGVVGYLASQQASSMYQSRADMLRTEAEAQAQRYSEQAAQFQAQEKVMYLASGVKLAGSPVDALATSARIANANMQAILMQGDVEAMNDETKGANAEMAGGNALITGFDKAAKSLSAAYPAKLTPDQIAEAGGGGVTGN